MKVTAVTLTDDELVRLDQHVRPEVQEAVNAARARITARVAWPNLRPAIAGLVADVVTEAETNGRLIYQRRGLRRCSLCGTGAGYVPFKSGRRKGEPNYDRPRMLDGIEFADRFVTIVGRVAVGGCTDCVTPAVPVIVESLRGVKAELPDALAAEGEPRWKRYANRRCTSCGWEGHEGEMRQARTLIGDGFYPSGCPACSAENRPLGRSVVEYVEGYAVIEAMETAR